MDDRDGQSALPDVGKPRFEGEVTPETKTQAVMARQDLRRVERAARRVAESREEMRIAVALARAAGETLDDIARAAGVTRQAVSAMLRRIAEDEKRRGGE